VAKIFIRTTPTRNGTTGERYLTHRLVESRRVGGQVRQVTLLNLGRHFSLDKAHWPDLCQRLDQWLSGQQGLMPQTVRESAERCAQHCFVRLVAQGGGQTSSDAASSGSAASPPEFAEIEPESLALTQPRSIGVEHVASAAMRELGFEPLLASLGINAVMRTAIMGAIIARMAMPDSRWPAIAGWWAPAGWAICWRWIWQHCPCRACTVRPIC
jgi:hypothetical protein